MVHYLDTSIAAIDNLRRRYTIREDADDDESEDRAGFTSPEHYLKDLFRMTQAFALRNGLFGRAEFQSEPVMAWFKKHPDMAFLWDPLHIMPFVDLFRHQFIATTFLMQRPDHYRFALETIEKVISSPACGELTDIEDFDDEDAWAVMEGALKVGDFALIEKLGFACVSRQACIILLHTLVVSHHLDSFLGLDGGELDDSFLVKVITHLVNSNSTKDGIGGRAMVIALLGYTMGLGEGRAMGQGVSEDYFTTPEFDDWCVTAAFTGFDFGLKLGLTQTLPDYPCAADFGKPSEEDFAKLMAKLAAIVKGNE
jgi:hypothetical protein